MNKNDSAKVQTFILKLNIHCDGCKQKIKKLLQKIDGVYTIKIDADQGKATISGTVNPATVIKKLEQSGKQAQLWGSQKGSIIKKNELDFQIKNMGVQKGKESKENKLKINSFQPQEVKGAKGFKMPPKGQRSVKFEEDEFDSSGDDDDDGLEDDEDDDQLEYQYGKAHLFQKHNLSKGLKGFKDFKRKGMSAAPVKGGDGKQKENNKLKNAGKGGDVKKGGIFDIKEKIMGMMGKKNGKGSKTGCSHGEKSEKNPKKSKGKVENKDGSSQSKAKRGGNDGFYDFDMPQSAKAGNNGQMGNYPMGPYGNFPPVQGHPAMGGGGGYYPGSGGHYPGMNPTHPYMPPPYMMMNQPMMYARPPPPVGYMPPMPPPPMADRYTHFFSDENTDSCNVM